VFIIAKSEQTKPENKSKKKMENYFSIVLGYCYRPEAKTYIFAVEFIE